MSTSCSGELNISRHSAFFSGSDNPRMLLFLLINVKMPTAFYQSTKNFNFFITRDQTCPSAFFSPTFIDTEEFNHRNTHRWNGFIVALLYCKTLTFGGCCILAIFSLKAKSAKTRDPIFESFRYNFNRAALIKRRTWFVHVSIVLLD